MPTQTTPARSVEEVILKLIAHTIRSKRERDGRASSQSFLVPVGAAFTPEDLKAGDPRFDLLLELSDEDLRKVEVLVYAGRDTERSTLRQVARSVPREDKDETAGNVLGKEDLDEYLILGWAQFIKETGDVGLQNWNPDAIRSGEDEANDEEDDET